MRVGRNDGRVRLGEAERQFAMSAARILQAAEGTPHGSSFALVDLKVDRYDVVTADLQVGRCSRRVQRVRRTAL